MEERRGEGHFLYPTKDCFKGGSQHYKNKRKIDPRRSYPIPTTRTEPHH
jgi:hypothetical protein